MTNGTGGPERMTSKDCWSCTSRTPRWKSPLVLRVLNQTSGVLHGHDELRTFFVRGTEGRPNDLVRWYRTGEFMFDKRTLIWEYPRQAPEWEQVDLVEVMELAGPHIAHHRIYWGWYGTPLLQPHR
jgi:hypothetical protein